MAGELDTFIAQLEREIQRDEQRLEMLTDALEDRRALLFDMLCLKQYGTDLEVSELGE